MLGSVMTTLQFMGDGVQRIGNEVCPVVPEENEDEEWAASECAASAARDAAPEQGALEFEEVVVPLTEVSSRELFLAELLQSDQCQLLASLSQVRRSPVEAGRSCKQVSKPWPGLPLQVWAPCIASASAYFETCQRSNPAST
eukprot:g5322.t1